MSRYLYRVRNYDVYRDYCYKVECGDAGLTAKPRQSLAKDSRGTRCWSPALVYDQPQLFLLDYAAKVRGKPI